jgi:hypothetical protein
MKSNRGPFARQLGHLIAFGAGRTLERRAPPTLAGHNSKFRYQQIRKGEGLPYARILDGIVTIKDGLGARQVTAEEAFLFYLRKGSGGRKRSGRPAPNARAAVLRGSNPAPSATN